MCVYIYRCGTLEMYNDVGDSLCHFGLGYKNVIFREILLPAAASSKTVLKKSAPGGENTMPLKDELVPKPRKKIP